MKKIFLILFAGFLCACNNGNNPTVTTPYSVKPAEDFDWLLGTWQRANEQENRETFEIWSRKNASEYLGSGFTLQDKDTIWQEDVRLVRTGSSWNFEVTGKGETSPTIFRLTSIEKESFSCENPENEFPKNIAYARDGEKIMAVIAGGGTELPFLFERVGEGK